MSSYKSRSTPSKRPLSEIHKIGSKAVKFNPEVVETSIGGTQSAGTINVDVSLSMTLPGGFSPSSSPLKIRKSPLKVTISPKRKSSDSDSDRPTKKTSPSDWTMATPIRNRLSHQLDRVASTPDCFASVALETPKPKKVECRRSSSMVNFSDDDNCGVTVAVRLRPFNQRELVDENVKRVVSMAGNETIVTSEAGLTNRFTYDYSFWSFDRVREEFASQEYVYNMVAQPMLGKAFEGYNTCLFAYGQTGSGKSYSIMGHGEEEGIVPRFTEEIFQRIECSVQHNARVNVEISYFEIYNEKIHDLLSSAPKGHGDKKQQLKVREHPVLGPYVEGLSSFLVQSYDDIQSWINLGNKQRATAYTGMNDKSSRSHSVFTILLTQTKTEVLEGEDHDHSVTSRINLVDLAGSERQTLAQTSGVRLKEGASINKSLHALGKVISLLSDQSDANNKKKKLFIPYRDSVLTWLLKESLGGNSKTTMLATVSPANTHIEETLSTLRYARQARSIVNVARVNEDPKAKIIRELRAEIEILRGVSVGGEDLGNSSLAEVVALREMLKLKELEMQEVTRSWQEKLQRSEAKKLEESLLMEKEGITFKVDNHLPSLVNLNEDPQLSEMLLYVIKEGKTNAGRSQKGSQQDIQLNGVLVADEHCVLQNKEGVVTIIPVGDALTYVNGELITAVTTLYHGDRVIIGGDHYFRFNQPLKKHEGRKVSSSVGQKKDYEFAHRELIEAQNSRIQAELEEAKKLAQSEIEKAKREADRKLDVQKHNYEDKLAELEKALAEQNLQKLQSEEDRHQTERDIAELRRQKDQLEHDILSNHKKLELQAIDVNKAVAETKASHNKLLGQLQMEQQKIQQTVEKLAVKRQKRANTPVSLKRETSAMNKMDHWNTPVSVKRDASGMNKTDLYRNTLLLREANRISQFLNKNTLFKREDGGEDGQTPLINVTNTKLGITTFWTVRKFEDKLQLMRELYQGDSLNTTAAEEIFYDPNDSWERVDRINTTSDSPRLLSDLTRRTRRMSSLETINKTPNSNSASVKDSKVKSNNGSMKSHGIPVIGLCRDFVVLSLDRFKEMNIKESLPDRILYNCDCLKVAVSTLLDSYDQSKGKLSADKDCEFIQSEVVEVSSMQIMTSLELVLTHCSLWASSFDNMGSSLVQEMNCKIMDTVRKLGNQLVLFMQGVENDIASMVKQSSTEILDSVFSICRYCGEVATATNTFMKNLVDTLEISLDEEDEFIKLGHDIRQSFLAGCDLFIDKTLLGGLKTVEDCESQVQLLTEQWSDQSKITVDILKHMEIVTATTKILLLKCQEIQVELDSTLRESMEIKPDNFYHRNYLRNQKLVGQVSSLVDNISLLTQAVRPLVKGKDGDLRQLCKCAEMIQKSTVKLLVASDTVVSSDNQSECSDYSVLSDFQSEQLDIAGQEVKLATKTLITLIKKCLDTKVIGTPTKTRRLLPASPDKGLNTPSLHRQKHTIHKNTSLIQSLSSSNKP